MVGGDPFGVAGRRLAVLFKKLEDRGGGTKHKPVAKKKTREK